MIFCKNLLFLHVPKTGGMSLTSYLLGVLPRPVYYTRPHHQPRRPVPAGIVDLDGKRHEILAEARDVVRTHGLTLADFPALVATVRNPYDLEVSRYTHFHRPYVAGRGRPAWELAMNEDFTTFALKSRPHRGKGLEHYFLLDGAMPDNMVVLRFERLAEDLRDALARVGIVAEGELPHTNVSRHDHFVSYYTKRAEEAVYRKYQWVFDQGFYERLAVAERPPELREYGQKLPLDGPVSQVGPSEGLWSDLWVGERLAFRVKAKAAVRTMTVEGRVPASVQDGISLTVTADGRSTDAPVQRGEFALDVECALEEGARADIEIVAGSSWSSSIDGLRQDRALSFALKRIVFQG